MPPHNMSILDEAGKATRASDAPWIVGRHMQVSPSQVAATDFQDQVGGLVIQPPHQPRHM